MLRCGSMTSRFASRWRGGRRWWCDALGPLAPMYRAPHRDLACLAGRANLLGGGRTPSLKSAFDVCPPEPSQSLSLTIPCSYV